MGKKKLVVLTGAGISAESGIKTFRDSDGLWENHRIEEVATPEGWRANPALVLEFYNQRRRQLFEVVPNDGHRASPSPPRRGSKRPGRRCSKCWQPVIFEKAIEPCFHLSKSRFHLIGKAGQFHRANFGQSTPIPRLLTPSIPHQTLTPRSRNIVGGAYAIFTNRLVYHGLFWAVLFAVLLFFGKNDEQGWWFTYTNELINLVFFAIIVYFNLLFLIPNYLAKNRAFFYLCLLTLTVVLITPLKMIVYYVKFGGLPSGYRESLILNQSRFFLANGLIAISSTVLRIITDWFRSQKEREQLLTQNMQSELRFLRSQINPHFLFNTLNSLYALTLKKDAKAPEIVLKLSEIMRYMLYECNEKRVPLSKEVQYIRNHLDLERLRLQKNFDITFTVDGQVAEQEIAPLMFIPFLENAFKHGLSNSITDGFCHIKLKAETERIEFFIENSKPEMLPQPENRKSGGIGLNNIKQRLNLIYPNNHQLHITDGSAVFSVNLSINLN